jgi:hypothetical protein
MERVRVISEVSRLVIVKQGVDKSNHPIQNPLLLGVELLTRDNINTDRRHNLKSLLLLYHLTPIRNFLWQSYFHAFSDNGYATRPFWVASYWLETLVPGLQSRFTSHFSEAHIDTISVCSTSCFLPVVISSGSIYLRKV